MAGVSLSQTEFDSILDEIQATAGRLEVSPEDLKTHVVRMGYRVPLEELPEDTRDLERRRMLWYQTCLDGASAEEARTALLARISA